MRKSITLLSIFFLTLFVSFAQFKRQREYSGFFDTYYYRGPITFTFGGGLTTYRGDLTDGLGLNGLSYGFSLGANYKIWPHIVLGTELSYLNFQAKDFNKTRNVSFKTNGYEFQIYGRLYIIDEIVRVSPDRRKESHYTFCKPYIHLGVGAMMFSPTLNYNNPNAAVPSISGGSSVAFVIPAGLGLQFTITQRTSLCLEYVYRFTTTDYIDNLTFMDSKNDGFGLLQAKIQFAPTAPKRRKKLSLPPPAQYDGVKGTETWKTRKQQQESNKPQREEYQMPDENLDENNEYQEEEYQEEPYIEEEVAPE